MKLDPTTKPSGSRGKVPSTGWVVMSALSLGVPCAFAQTGAGLGGPGAIPETPLVVDYGFTARQEYVDNIGFSGRPSFVTSVGPSAVFRSDSETRKLFGSASLNAVYYSNEQAGGVRASEPRFGFGGSWLDERSTYSVAASFFRDRSFFGDKPAGTAGFLVTGDRTFFSIGPSYSYAVTQRLSMSANYNYGTINFSGSQPGQVDSESHSGGGGFQYRLTELDTLGVSASVSQFSTKPETTSSKSQSVQASWNRRWSELTTVSAYLGVSVSEVDGRANQVICLVPLFFCQTGQFPFQVVTVNTASRTTSPTYGFTLSTQLAPRTSFAAQMNRRVQPGGGGSLTDSTVLSAGLTHRFTERVNGGLDYGWQQTELVGFSEARQVAVQTLSGSLSYSLQDNWSLSGGARLSQSDALSANTQSMAVFITLAKTWPNNVLFGR